MHLSTSQQSVILVSNCINYTGVEKVLKLIRSIIDYSIVIDCSYTFLSI